MTKHQNNSAWPAAARAATLVAAGVTTWLLIQLYFRVVESGSASAWRWTDPEARIWIEIAIFLFAPIVVMVFASLVVPGGIPLPAVLVPAVVLGASAGYHYAAPYEYDNGTDLVVPVFTQWTLSVTAMGMMLPVLIGWQRNSQRVN